MSDCARCGGRDFLCQQCKMDEQERRMGVPADHFETGDEVDVDDELEYECTSCGHRYVGPTPCPECGAFRRRYVGPIGDGGVVATDGGVELVPATIDYDDLIGAECPCCGEEMTPGGIRWAGSWWEHKSTEAHDQAGHHCISETLEDHETVEVITDGGQTQLVDDEDPFGIALAKGDEIAVKYETPRSDYPQTRTGTVMGSGTVEREYGPTGSTEIRVSGGLTLWPAWDEIRSEDAGRLGEIVDVRRVETDGGVDAYLSDEGPHKCDICELPFLQIQGLANHVCIPQVDRKPKPASTVFRGPADPPEEWTGGGV